MSMNFSAVGIVADDGTAAVKVTVEVVLPLGSGDEVANLIRKAGTQAVLALGAFREKEGQQTAAVETQEPQQCVMSKEQIAAQLAEYAKQDAGSGSC